MYLYSRRCVYVGVGMKRNETKPPNRVKESYTATHTHTHGYTYIIIQMTTSMAEDKVRIDLLALASLKPEQKVSVWEEYIALESASSKWVGILRYLRGDGRIKTVERLKLVVQTCIEISQDHAEFLTVARMLTDHQASMKSGSLRPVSDLFIRSRERRQRLELLTAAMRESLTGFESLRRTYQASVAAQIKVLHCKMECQIRENAKFVVTDDVTPL